MRAEVRNENALDVENLELQMIVPKYMLFRLRNNSDGKKETVVRLRVMFQLGKEEVNEMVQVSGFDDDA